jgi:hypothetical protein
MSNRFQTREDWLAQAIATNCVPCSLLSTIRCPTTSGLLVAFPAVTPGLPRTVPLVSIGLPRLLLTSTHEILISPVVDDVFRVLGILVHELAHASTDGDGHKGRFPALVKALSLEGKPTATTEGAKFKAEYLPLLEDLGVYPHAKL